MNSRELIKRLRKEGWIQVAQAGSHTQWKHPDRAGRVTISHPSKDIPLGTLRSIFRQAGWIWPPR